MQKENKKKIVLTFGTFDILHLGHQYYLSQAKKYGDHLVTIIARDSTVLKVKWRLPSHNEQTRLQNLTQTKRSDEVVLGHESGFDRCLDYYKPDVICMGYDQGDVSWKLQVESEKWNKSIIYNLKSKISLVRIAPYKPEKRKSSILAKK